VPEPSAFDVDMVIEKLIRHKSPGVDQIPAKLIKAGGKKISSNYTGISLLSTMYKILSNILLSRLTTYTAEIIRNHQYGFRRKRSTKDHTFCIRQILQKKMGIQGSSASTTYIHSKKVSDSVRSKVLCNTLNEFGIPMKPARLIKMCLNENYTRVWVGKQLSGMFPVRNSMKEVDALKPLLFKFALEYAIRRVQVNQDGLKLNGTHQLLVFVDDIILGGSVHTKEKHKSFVSR